ncbi:hypothetical protein EMIHUDRAFT_116795 [Emiliania huxleyi CCMP1516]|uniref:Uncharacterized protein n=2 Tax=Emiliania huxleyi TaxID=2903 RepID=A0A0D3JFV9_EMIH1|nr:hypothetical protein EMIHUDRAFT_116795 [Emiliania huxleyi CCMP1516]EOD22394.1 hypothetical protein EMIHUDRAFT_116795 [Emiliania huxleyi CCMP1516]|eukprot:XP_005774823.1 hypothetical protein EMIHUDRAFT_116795 [Emiliania huxleyi CCMP1516]
MSRPPLPLLQPTASLLLPLLLLQPTRASLQPNTLPSMAPPPWSPVRAPRIADRGAGRYTQARSGADGNVTLCWNAVEPEAGLRLARCGGSSCEGWSHPPTLVSGADGDPRFIRMRMAHRSSRPVLCHTSSGGRALSLGICLDAVCSQFKAVELERAVKVRHCDLESSGREGTRVAAALSDEAGSRLVLLRVDLPTGSVAAKTVLATAADPFTVNETTRRPERGIEGPVLADRRSSVVVAQGGGAGVAAAGGMDALLLTFFDLARHSLFLARCFRLLRRCDAPRRSAPAAALGLGLGRVIRGDALAPLSDFGAGAFPDLALSPHGAPALAYFVEASPSRGCLRVLRCSDPLCGSWRLFDASCGPRGYGRDASLAFGRDGAIVASFLDLDGHDDPARMIARVAVYNDSQGAVLAD